MSDCTVEKLEVERKAGTPRGSEERRRCENITGVRLGMKRRLGSNNNCWKGKEDGLNVKMAHVERQGESKDRQEMEGKVEKFMEHRWSVVGEYEVGCILEGFG